MVMGPLCVMYSQIYSTVCKCGCVGVWVSGMGGMGGIGGMRSMRGMRGMRRTVCG